VRKCKASAKGRDGPIRADSADYAAIAQMPGGTAGA